MRVSYVSKEMSPKHAKVFYRFQDKIIFLYPLDINDIYVLEILFHCSSEIL